MKSSIKKDLDTLSKNLYLESPDLWIEFLDKVNSGIFDELVLFFATKYNYISIVKYAIDNNLIDINSKSRNKEFATIYDHLVYVARQNNYKDLSNYFSNLKNPNKEISQNNENDKTNIKTKNKTHCKVQEDGGVRRKVVTFTDKLVVLPSHNRVKVMFECPNHSGSISSILSMISDYGVNLTEIHSRPFWKDNSWNYKFFVEMNANIDTKEIRALIYQLSQETAYLKILGSYACEGDF